MLSKLRLSSLAAIASLVVVAAVVAGCGNSESVPAGAIAQVGNHTITKAEFNHWLLASAKQQAQSTGATGAAADAVVPDPPNFTSCVAAKEKQPVPKGVPQPQPAQLKTQCSQEYQGLRDQTLQFLISSQWLIQEAAKQGVSVSEQEVTTTFNQQKKQSFPKEADYQKFLQTSGQTEADLRYRVRLSVLTNKLQAKIVKGKGNVTDAQIQSYYNRNKTRFAQPEMRDLLVVLTAKKPQAEAALKAINSGQPWAKVAKKYSTDDASKAQGGKLPNVTKGQQEKTLDTAIFAAPLNKVQGPVQTQFGYYVFKVTKITPAAQQGLAQVKETIRSLLASQGQQKALNDFVTAFRKRHTDQTVCAKGFNTVQECKNAPKAQTNTGPVNGAAPQSSAPPQGAVPQGSVPQGSVPQQGAPQQVPQQGGP